MHHEIQPDNPYEYPLSLATFHEVEAIERRSDEEAKESVKKANHSGPPPLCCALMKSYDRFLFDSYVLDLEHGKITLNYALEDDVTFTETLIIPREHATKTNAALDAALFALHLIGGISYFKTCLPVTMEIRSGSLTETEATFWNTVYENGLGEFFFKNNIDPAGVMHFPGSATEKKEKQEMKKTMKRMLVPIGGGKDSTVTAELLKKAGYDVTLLRVGHHPFIDHIASIAGLPLLTIERHLSPALFELNAKGALNGHVPITAYLSVLAVVVAMIEGFDAVVWSNEHSSSFGNVTFHGREINHQWSKSLEFERAFQDYLQTTIETDIASFSLLRPWSELKIVQKFVEYPQYLRAFTSCNANWKILGKKEEKASAWCGTCPKCAFAFLLMAAYLPTENTTEIFGKNLFEEKALAAIYRELLGLEGFKPFECVGTPEECRAALLLAHRRGDMEKTDVMMMFVKDVLPTINHPDMLIDQVFAVSRDHMIPKPFQDIVLS